MSTIESNKKDFSAKGTISNPYTEEEYQQLLAEGKDVACYVEGRGFCAPAAMAPPTNPGSPSDSSDSSDSSETSRPFSHDTKVVNIPPTEVTDGNFKYIKTGQISCDLRAYSIPETQDIGEITVVINYWGKIEGMTNTIEDTTYTVEGNEYRVENLTSSTPTPFPETHPLIVKYITEDSNSFLPITEERRFELKAEWSVGYDPETSCVKFKKIKISIEPEL